MAVARTLKTYARHWAHGVFGVLFSAGCICWILKDIEINYLIQVMRSVQPRLLVGAMMFGLLSLLVRTVRWRVLLAKEAQAETKNLFTSLMIGYFANNLLPARMGELVRVFVLERRTGISKSSALASIVLERLADVLMLLVLMGVAATFVQLPPLIVGGSWMAVGGVTIAILLLTFLSGRSSEQNQRLFDFVDRRRTRLGQRLRDAAGCFIAGLGAMRNRHRVFVTLMLSLLVWGLEAGGAWIVAASLGLQLPWVAAVLVITVIGISSVLPAAPGSVGTYEFFAILALSPFSVGDTHAVAMAFLLHLSTYLLVAPLGVVSLWIENSGEAGFGVRTVFRDARAS